MSFHPIKNPLFCPSVVQIIPLPPFLCPGCLLPDLIYRRRGLNFQWQWSLPPALRGSAFRLMTPTEQTIVLTVASYENTHPVRCTRQLAGVARCS